jgi:hypothetical protein
MFFESVCEQMLSLEPNREEVTEGWTKLHNEEFQNLHPSHYIIKMIDSKRTKRVGHILRMKMSGMRTQFLSGNLK